MKWPVNTSVVIQLVNYSPSLPFCHSFSLTALMCTRAHCLSVSLSLCLFLLLSLSLSLSLSGSLSLIHAQSYRRTDTHTHTFSLSLSLFLKLSFSLLLSYSFSHSLFNSFSASVSLSVSIFLVLSSQCTTPLPPSPLKVFLFLCLRLYLRLCLYLSLCLRLRLYRWEVVSQGARWRHSAIVQWKTTECRRSPWSFGWENPQYNQKSQRGILGSWSVGLSWCWAWWRLRAGGQQVQSARKWLTFFWLLRKKESSKTSLLALLEALFAWCRFEFSIFGVFAGIEPANSGQAVPCSDQLS